MLLPDLSSELRYMTMQQKLCKAIFKRTHSRGQSLILALVVLFFGTLLIVSLLSYMGTGMKTTSQVYDVKASELYAADAGVVDAEWKIRNGDLDTVYPAFDFVNPFPSYTLGSDINDSQVDVQINNVWVPVDIHGNSLTPPSQTNAGRLINGVNGNPPKMIITSNVMLPSSMDQPGTVEIKVQYYPSSSSENPLISMLGIWLPNGYLYDTATPSTLDSYAGAPTVMTYKGGQAVLWNLNGYPFEGNETSHQAAFPRDVDGNPLDPHMATPLVSNIYFYFWQKTAQLSPPVAWVQNTNIDLTQGGSPAVNYTWDGNVQVYHIESSAESALSDHTDGTKVDSYLVRTELRNLGNVQMGVDYYAIGAPLLTTGSNYRLRNVAYTPAPIPVNHDGIPDDAQIQKALLFWSAWKDNMTNLFNDDCDNFYQWTRSGTTPYTNTSWKANGNFSGHYGGGGDDARYLKSNTINLSSYYNNYKLALSWNQSVAALSSSFFTDYCSNFNNFTAGSAWSINNEKFRGNVWGLTNPGRDVIKKSVNNLGTGSGTVKVYWDQSVTVPTTTTLLSDSCSAANFNSYWTSGQDWSYNSSGSNYKGHHSNANSDIARYLTTKNVIDLANLGTGTANISFDTPIIPSPTPVLVAPLNPDTCVNFSNWTPGSAWSTNSGNFKAAGANISSANRDLVLKNNTLNLSSYGTTGTIDISLDSPVLAAPAQSTALNETADNITTNWTPGSAWSNNSGNFKAIGYGKSGTQLDLTLKNSKLNLSTLGKTGTINISMDTPVLGTATQSTALTETCDNLNLWTNGGTWGTSTYNNGSVFRGNCNSDGGLTINNAVNLSQYATTGSIVISWSQYADSTLSSTQGLNWAYSTNNGSSWTTISAFQGPGPSSSYSYTIPSGTLSSSFKIRLSTVRGNGSSYYNRYVYIDNITIKVVPSYSSSDKLSLSYSLDGGNNWTTNQVFYGNLQSLTTSWDIADGTLPGNMLLKFTLSGFSASWQYCTIDNIKVKVTPSYSSVDGLNFAYSTDNGGNWTTGPVFTGNLQSLDIAFNIPDITLPSNLLLKFSIVGFDYTWQYCTIDNISVKVTLNYLATDGLDLAYSLDNGNTWTTKQVFRGADTASAVTSFDIPYDTSHNKLLVRFILRGFNIDWQYCCIDNIVIKATPSYTKSDGLDFYYSLNGGTTWTKKIVFRGPDLPPSGAEYNIHFDSATNNNNLLFKFSLVGFSNPGLYCYIDNINVQNTYSDTDTIYVSFSKDGGASWSTPPVQGYYGNIGTDRQAFSTLIPNDYLTSNFKMRFYLGGFDGDGKYCYIDDIEINKLTPDQTVNLTINTHQTSVTTSLLNTQTMPNYLDGYSSPSEEGYSYSCWADVTDVVKTYAETKSDGNCPGQGSYSVSGVDYDTGSEISYAGWSLVLIYKSPETKNHMLFLYKDFMNSNQNGTDGVNVDFDRDGKPGGTISGFLVPQQEAGEINAGKVSCFVGEGDDHYAGDFLAINSPENYWSHPKDIPGHYKLWDGTTSTYVSGSNTQSAPDNIWNSKSIVNGEEISGIDVDTLGSDPNNGKFITWSSGILKPGDTAAHIDLFTKTDVWNLVYIIFSFRSVPTTGSALNYHIQ